MTVHALLLALTAAAPQVPGMAVAQAATTPVPPYAGDADPAVREYLTAARRVRDASATALAAYDVRLYHRASVAALAGPFARERTLLALERVERVRWSSGGEPRIEVLAVHRSAPALNGDRPRPDPVDAAGELIELPSLPFYPGSPTLWPESLLGPSSADSTDGVIDPLAPGAEEVYRYSLRRPRLVRTPDGRSRLLQELRIRPNGPHPTLLVADLWFDPQTLVLVRAAYRPSAPIDVIARKLTPVQRTGVLRWTSPARVAVRSIIVEYEARRDSVSLPRSRTFEAVLDVPFVRVPLRVEEAFEYAEVATTTLAAASVPRPATVPNSDSSTIASADSSSISSPDSTSTPRPTPPAAALPAGTRPGTRNAGRLVWILPVADSAAQVPRPRLGDVAAGPAGVRLSAREVHERSIRLGAIRPRWNPRPPEFRHLSDLAGRYNRVQGPSFRFASTQELPLLTLEVAVRVPLGEPFPEGEVNFTPAGGPGHPRLSLFRRLTAANEWDDPLGLGNSLSALLLARDNGLYFRVKGVELVGGAAPLSWRLFAERQTRARRHVNFTLPALFSRKLLSDRPLEAEAGSSYGLALRARRLIGITGAWRVGSDARFELAAGEAEYGRVAWDLTGLRPIGHGLEGAVTAGLGTSAGHLPVQRLWYLGGSESVRGFNPGDAAGSAYWRLRAELGLSRPGVRPALFADLGAPADHLPWRRSGATLAGVGISLSFLDGLVRLDAARALHPTHRWWAGATTDTWF